MFNLKQITFSRIMLLALAIVMIMSIGLNLRNEIGNWRTKVFNEGKEAGRLEGASQVWGMLSYQFTTTGRLELPSNNSQGTTTIIFLPQK